MTQLKDPRTEDFFLMGSPFPTIAILTLWLLFIFKWGPEYMKNREPVNLKYVMIAYNVAQVVINLYILYYVRSLILKDIKPIAMAHILCILADNLVPTQIWIWLAREVVNWKCTEIDYSRSHWGMIFANFTYMYCMLKIVDLLDTVFFVLRKKNSHVSFLHVYHHFGMAALGWVGTRFVAGGHLYFLGVANCPVHAILYGYYLLTAYDSKYSKLLWLKKFITQTQLIQFAFVLFMFGQLAFRPDCNFPKIIIFFLIPQNFFMIILFADFYVRTYHLEPRRKRKELEEKRKMRELEEQNKNVLEKRISEESLATEHLHQR